MSDNPLENLIRLQLVALTEMRKQLRDQNSKLTRLENRLDHVSHNIDRLARKEATNGTRT